MSVNMLKYEIGKILRKKAYVPKKYTTQQVVGEWQIRKKRRDRQFPCVETFAAYNCFHGVAHQSNISLLIYELKRVLA